MKDIGEQICELVIESKRIAKELERIWNRYYEIKLGNSSSTNLPCDACEDRKNFIRTDLK